MKPFALPKSGLLTKPWEYKAVYDNGKRLRGKNFSLICLATAKADTRLGISIHGIKEAVKRNRIKRIIREFYRLNRTALPPATDMVFTVRRGFSPDSPDEVKTAVFSLLKTAGSLSPSC
ncbi:MAG: ribonuclease P protein component [Desulfobulbaceae bacterium]|nr:ribonuclease P protein component [Desulfobulbaceae bacterium]